MQESIFESEFVRGKAALKEIYRHHYFCSPMSIFLYVFSGIYLASFAFAWILIGYLTRSAIFSVVSVGAAVILLISAHFFATARVVKRDAEICGGTEPKIINGITESELFSSLGENTSRVGIENIKYAFQTKNYVVVVTKEKWMFIFKKDAFLKGSAGELLDFLRSRSVKIWGRKKKKS
jgi:hypothetical protein